MSEFQDFVNKYMQGLSAKKKVTNKDVDPKELKMGIEVEYEHTKNKKVAERIARDHLAEFSDYYTRLRKMEKEAEEEMKKNK